MKSILDPALDPNGARRLTQVFARLKDALLSRVQALGAPDATRPFAEHVRRIRLEFGPGRSAYGASTSIDTITVEEWLSRADPAAMTWVLGHELAHTADPCYLAILARYDTRAAGFIEGARLLDPVRAVSCPAADDAAASELYADRLGAVFLADIASSLILPEENDARRAALLEHGLQPDCDVSGARARLDAFLDVPRARELLRCEAP